MRTQSPDTTPEAERQLIELIREAPLTRRLRLVQSLSQRWLSARAPRQETQAQAILAISWAYGPRIEQRV